MKSARFIPFLFAVALFIAATPQMAAADDEAKQKLVIDMFKVLQYDRVLDQMADVVSQQVGVAVKQKHPSVGNDVLNMIRDVTREEFRGLAPQMARFSGGFLTRNFSENELQTMLAFYKTSAGQKTLTVMPQMMQEMMPFIGSLVEQAKAGLVGKLKARLAEQGYSL